MDSLKVELVSVAFVIAGHLDRLLLCVSCTGGEKMQKISQNKQCPSNQRPYYLDTVYWTPGPPWKSSDRDRGEHTELCGWEKRREKKNSAKPTLSHSKNHLKFNPLHPASHQNSWKPLITQQGCDFGLFRGQSYTSGICKHSDQLGRAS